MAISTPSFFAASPKLAFNSHPPPQSVSNSVKFRRSQISATYATAEKTIKSFCSPSSLYEVLGVGVQEVKAAYRRLARVLHPDVGSGADEFMKVHSAYTTLADPERRAEYDRSLVQRRRGMRFGTSRRWETDQCW